MTHCSKCHRWIDSFGDFACKCSIQDLREEIEKQNQIIISFQNTFGWLKIHLESWKKEEPKSKGYDDILNWLEKRKNNNKEKTNV